MSVVSSQRSVAGLENVYEDGRARSEPCRSWLQNVSGPGPPRRPGLRRARIDAALPTGSVGLRTLSRVIEAVITEITAVFERIMGYRVETRMLSNRTSVPL